MALDGRPAGVENQNTWWMEVMCRAYEKDGDHGSWGHDGRGY
jgi:hypothetical protein